MRELLKEGGDVNEADTFHMTAVHYAAQNGFKTILQDLIDAKANVNVKNKVRRLVGGREGGEGGRGLVGLRSM